MEYPHPYAIPGIKLQKETAIEQVHKFLVQNFNLLKLKNETRDKNYQELTIDNIKSKKRYRALAVARMLIVYYLREKQNMSFTEIGQHIGGKHHASVIHAYQTVESEPEIIERFKQKFGL